MHVIEPHAGSQLQLFALRHKQLQGSQNTVLCVCVFVCLCVCVFVYLCVCVPLLAVCTCVLPTICSCKACKILYCVFVYLCSCVVVYLYLRTTDTVTVFCNKYCKAVNVCTAFILPIVYSAYMVRYALERV